MKSVFYRWVGRYLLTEASQWTRRSWNDEEMNSTWVDQIDRMRLQQVRRHLHLSKQLSSVNPFLLNTATTQPNQILKKTNNKSFTKLDHYLHRRSLVYCQHMQRLWLSFFRLMGYCDTVIAGGLGLNSKCRSDDSDISSKVGNRTWPWF